MKGTVMLKKALFYLVFGVMMWGYGWLMCCAWENQIARESNKSEPVVEYYPLMKRTIMVGRSAKVVYIERWEVDTDPASCQSSEIVWPAGASESYIKYMLKHSRGKMENHFALIGWWKKQ